MKLARGGCCGVFEHKADDRVWQSIVWLGLVRRDALGCVLHLDRESGWDHAFTLLYDLSLGIAKRAGCWRSFLGGGVVVAGTRGTLFASLQAIHQRS